MAGNYQAKKRNLEYVLSCLHNEDRDGKELKTEAEKLKNFFDVFRSEYGWAIERYGMQKAITEYLQGLGGTIDLEYWNSEIIKLGYQWGFLKIEKTAKRTENKEIDFCNNWFSVTAFRLIELARKHKVEI